MELLLYTFAIFFSLIVLFIIVEHPYYMVGVVVFLMVYRFNIEIPLPLDARGLLTLVLFVRLYIFDKENAKIVNEYLIKNKIFWFFIIFNAASIIAPLANSEKFLLPIKDTVLNTVFLVIGFLALSNKKGKNIFLYAIIFSSLLGSVDLIYTYIVGGGLNIVRFIDVIFGNPVIILNHNYSGMLAAFGLLFVYLIFVRKEASRLIMILVFLILLVGVFLSTSRSALMALFFTFLVMNFIEIDLRANIKKLLILGSFVFILFIGYFFVYNLALKTVGEDTFADKVYYRLIDEPLQLVGLTESKYFDIYSNQAKKGSMKFRLEKWEDDFNKFKNFKFISQLFGLGENTYLKIAEMHYGNRGLIQGRYLAHNGYLIILVERGVVGLLLYFSILISIFMKSFNVIKYYQLKPPVIYLVLFVAFYSFTQNEELVSTYMYLFMGGVLGNVYSSQILENDTDNQN